MADIQDHLAESAPAGASEAEVRTALDRLGDPDQIVAAEHETASRAGGEDRWNGAAIILLLVGGIVIPVVGWLVGALLLWVSQAWTLRDKLIGTLLRSRRAACPPHGWWSCPSSGRVMRRRGERGGRRARVD